MNLKQKMSNLQRLRFEWLRFGAGGTGEAKDGRQKWAIQSEEGLPPAKAGVPTAHLKRTRLKTLQSLRNRA